MEQETQPNIEALKRVIHVLNEVERQGKKFDLNIFMEDKNECGTSACAVGWCMMDPWHNARGFVRVQSKEQDDPDNIIDYYPQYNGLSKFMAVKAFYGLTLYQAEFLFHPDYYDEGDDENGTSKVSIKQVANRIQNFIEEHCDKDKSLNKLR